MTTPRRHSPALLGLLGAATAFALVCAAGILELQIRGRAGGGVFGLDNQIVAVQTPNAALGFRLALAVVAVAAIAACARSGRGDGPGAFAFPVAFSAVGAACVIAGGIRESMTLATFRLEDGYDPWALGWVVEGGMSAAVHVALGVALLLVVLELLRRRRDPSA